MLLESFKSVFYDLMTYELQNGNEHFQSPQQSLLLYILICLVVTQMCLLCKNTSYTLRIRALVFMYVILQLKKFTKKKKKKKPVALSTPLQIWSLT